MGEELSFENFIAYNEDTYECILVEISMSININDKFLRWEIHRVDPISRDYVQKELIKINLVQEDIQTLSEAYDAYTAIYFKYLPQIDSNIIAGLQLLNEFNSDEVYNLLERKFAYLNMKYRLCKGELNDVVGLIDYFTEEIDGTYPSLKNKSWDYYYTIILCRSEDEWRGIMEEMSKENISSRR